MKIIHIIPHYFPSPYFGGTPVVCHNIAKEQVKMGHQVDILTTDVYSETERINKNKLIENSESGYQVIRKRNLSNWIAFKFKQSLSIEAFRFIKNLKDKYDVVHLHEYRSLLNVMVAFTDLGKTRIILHPQGTFENFNSRSVAKSIFDFIFAKRILAKAEHFIAISDKEKNLFASEGINTEQITVMYNGIELNDSNDEDSILELPKKYILYLGRINKIKNIGMLIDAYLESEVRKYKVSLVIAGGDDGYLKELLEKIKDQPSIEYIGPVDHKEKNQLIKNALFVAYITQNEPWGLVPLEAAILKVPSLISKDAGVAGVVKEYQIGRMVDSNQKDSVAESIRLMINDPIKINQKTSGLLSDKFSWQKYAVKLMEIYSKG
jgi:glycosyltransferase involved in cell wall biosynthesis